MGFFFKRWLNRNFHDGKEYIMGVSYIIRHLHSYDRRKIDSAVSAEERIWQNSKAAEVMRALKAGKDPLRFEPIRLVLHTSKQQFKVDDGISRLMAFRMKGISKIRVKLRQGNW